MINNENAGSTKQTVLNLGPIFMIQQRIIYTFLDMIVVYSGLSFIRVWSGGLTTGVQLHVWLVCPGHG